MKEKWLNLNKLNKIGIILLITAFLVMILGLILIGVAKMPEKTIDVPIFGPQTIPSMNGFDILKSLSIGQVLSHSSSEYGWTSGSGAWLTLQLGCSLSVIITPILFVTTIGLFGYSFYLSKKNK